MKIHHLGLAVRSLEEAAAFYRDALGLELAGREEIPSEGVRVAFLPAGEPRIELLEALGEDSPVARFVAKRGEGIHHICFEVRDLDDAVNRAKEKGATFIDPPIRTGAGGARVAFVHPRSARGVLVELREAREAPSEGASFRPGAVVVLYVADPPSKFWGILRSVDAVGIAVEGIDLRSFDDWVRGVAASELGPRDASVAFYPLSRISKILLDQGTDAAPSLQDQFRARVGETILEFLGR